MDGSLEWHSATPMPSYARRLKDPEWERKQRQREYRVASRREKRNRKADEKKQRKLNATILRRMTRNPDKYTKNVERNRLRAIESERRKIQDMAVKQVQRLAAEYDPSGAMFNIGPVVKMEDGTVRSLESLRKREERLAAKTAKESGYEDVIVPSVQCLHSSNQTPSTTQVLDQIFIDPGRAGVLGLNTNGKKMSKTQLKKLAALAPRPPPPKPTIPQHISISESEENWLNLWDLDDNELGRRITREKKHKAAQRKALRLKQQAGKVERRAARDEKRKVYRDLKMTWKVIKASEKKHRTLLKSAEDREGKLLAVAIANHDRQIALQKCAELGYTIDNTQGTEDIKPKLQGMKGRNIDFNDLEFGEGLMDIRLKSQTDGSSTQTSRRVDLSKISQVEGAYLGVTESDSEEDAEEDTQDYIKLDIGEGQDFQALNLNHRLRRKIRRAIDAAQVQREILVRKRVIEVCEEKGIEPPTELSTRPRPLHDKGKRILENGLLESAKQERIRQRVELAEFNKAAKVLRQQAKERSLEAGLRVHAELTGRIPRRERASLDTDIAAFGPGWRPLDKPDPKDVLRPEDISLKPDHYDI